MIFEFSGSLKEIEINELADCNNIVSYVSATEFEKYHNNFGFCDSAYEKYTNENNNFRSKIEVCNDYSFGTIKIIEPDVNNKNETFLAFYIRKNMILIIEIQDQDHSSRKKFLEAIHRFSAKDYSAEKFIFAFIDSLIKSDNTGLENIEFEINRMEDKILNEYEFKNFNEELLKYKRKLLGLRNYYEQLIDIGEVFIENENGLFENKNLIYFKNFIQKSERLCSNVNLLRDSIVQLRETYQSHLDLRLNNTMKLFTVITAFFSPLTLIAGWYGMNFKYMPELGWKYGYIFVIALSICSVFACMFIFKRKKLM